jgi:hypothetical protein
MQSVLVFCTMPATLDPAWRSHRILPSIASEPRVDGTLALLTFARLTAPFGLSRERLISSQFAQSSQNACGEARI